MREVIKKGSGPYETWDFSCRRCTYVADGCLSDLEAYVRLLNHYDEHAVSDRRVVEELWVAIARRPKPEPLTWWQRVRRYLKENF